MAETREEVGGRRERSSPLLSDAAQLSRESATRIAREEEALRFQAVSDPMGSEMSPA
jgi:hypothetical protein